VETAQPRAVEKDLRLSVSMDKKLPDIAGDRRRLTEGFAKTYWTMRFSTLRRRSNHGQAESCNGEVVFTVSDTE